jgi:hypothetical protein
MGNEINCRAIWQTKQSDGIALLENDHLLFRGGFRCKLLFRDLSKVVADGGTLRLLTAGSELRLELGESAKLWAEKILYPKSRAAKLGLKPHIKVTLVRIKDAAFAEEITQSSAEVVPFKGNRDCDLLFFGARKAKDLTEIVDLVGRITDRGALWIIYPKGQAQIPESTVIQAGRAAGLKDVKVVSFSPTETGLKFVRPIEKRSQRRRRGVIVD